jgi:tRNA(fMet)-specific endonuclease VapC
VDVLLPDESTPELYGRISAQLAQAGTPIPQNDIWIAAIALQSDLPLATRDAHFSQVTGLQLLRW